MISIITHYYEAFIIAAAAAMFLLGITIGYIVGKTAQRRQILASINTTLKTDCDTIHARQEGHLRLIRSQQARLHSYKVHMAALRARLAGAIEELGE